MNYTKQANAALQAAKRLTKKLNYNYLGTEHLLYGLVKSKNSLSSQVLAAAGVTEDTIISLIEELISPGGEVAVLERQGNTPKLNYVLEQAAEEASFCGVNEIGTEHLLIALLKEPDCAGTRLLNSMDINSQKLFSEVVNAMGPDGDCYKAQSKGKKNGAPSGQMLRQYAKDLTEMAALGEMDPVIGRNDEINRLIQILSRRTKNNPCLLGEPGVGKTAIVEGLAQRISLGIVPDSVKDKRLMSLDLSGLVAGTKYRGEFEERIKRLIDEVVAFGDVILFVDEMHTLIGAGGSEGALDASNILKPAMARGDVQIIGATTISEYRKYVEKDVALARRFQSIMVEEPSAEETKEILLGIKPQYEIHHNVTISDEALDACVSLSQRYITDRFLPDKAIDLMDEAAARLRLMSVKAPENIIDLEEQINVLEEDIENSLKNQDVANASKLKKEKDSLVLEVEKAQKRYARLNSKKKLVVTLEDVADVVSLWTRIPVSKLTESEAIRLRNLEKTLHKRIIGQDEAVIAVSRAVRRGRVGLKEANRPIGSFLFLGPTGVGKTEISKTLAEAVFGTEESIVRVDMTEYMEKHSVSKMIGSPPGYVGYEEGGQLSEKVRRNPYCVILFDEIEKAHQDVFNVLLQVLDDGHITDAQGRKVDFKNTIIIMTSNAGAASIVEPKRLGFSSNEDVKADYEFMKNGVMEEVKRIFKPEFLNRIDETIVFSQLTKKEMKNIVSLMTRSLVTRCKDSMNIDLEIKDSVKTKIVEDAYDPKYGARPLRRKIQTELEDVLAEEILSGKFKSNDKVVITVKKDKIVMEKANIK